MAGLTVGGLPILVAPDSVSRPRDDGADRRSAFDKTYRVSQTGGARRDFVFSTPPVLRATADIYEAQLSILASQMCSGDIIAIPTMCCAEITGWHPVRLAVGHGVIIDFILHEAMPAKLLLKYAPGDTITGESFSRSTVAYQFNSSSVLVSKAINAKRDGHYIGGVVSTLLEETRTNHLIRANEFNNAAWTATFLNVGTGIADPAGGTTACTLTSTASDGAIEQRPSDSTSIVRTGSVWLKRRTGTGNIQLRVTGAGGYTTVAVTGTWTRFSIVGAASVIRQLDIRLQTSGDAVDAWCAQLEDGAFASSEIVTTTAALARGVSSYSLPFTESPKEMTVYAKFVEGGTILVTGSRLFQISSAATATPYFIGWNVGGFYQSHHANGFDAARTSTLAAAPALGNTVEIVFRLFGDGSVDITQSINGGASTSGAQSASAPLKPAWSGLLVWLNSGGTDAGSTGFIALQQFKIAAGSRSLAEMRTL